MSTGESWNGIMHDCMNMADCLYVSNEESEHFGEYFSANSLPSEVSVTERRGKTQYTHSLEAKALSV